MLRRVKEAVKRMPLLAMTGVFVLRVLRGFDTYRRILQACPAQEAGNIYFMDYDGSGDTYLTCGYLAYKGMIGPKDAFVGSGGLSLKIGKLFGFGRFVAVEAKAALNVRVMERFLGKRLELRPLLYESEYLEYSGILRFMSGYRGLDFMSMLKIGMDINCGLDYEEGTWTQPEFPWTPEEVEEIFQVHGLRPGKTALIAPYAGKNDMWGIPAGFYEKLAQQLLMEGFTVCTNSYDPQREPAVPGTAPILIPHRLMRAFCEKAGCFIGLRSGLCDIVSAAKDCKKIILYGEMTIPSASASHQEFFSLDAMGLCGDCLEVAYKSGQKDEIVSQLVSAAKAHADRLCI